MKVQQFPMKTHNTTVGQPHCAVGKPTLARLRPVIGKRNDPNVTEQRATGIEPATSALARPRSTVELRPRSLTSIAGLSVLALYFCCFAVFASAAKPHKSPPKDQSTYERAVNVTLDAVMSVHEQHKGKLTWAQLNQEVCRYMKVRRLEPWQR